MLVLLGANLPLVLGVEYSESQPYESIRPYAHFAERVFDIKGLGRGTPLSPLGILNVFLHGHTKLHPQRRRLHQLH